MDEIVKNWMPQSKNFTNIDNVIINYYEQTEQITTNRKIEIRLQEVKMEYKASNAVLAKL